jgi:YggT family protein
VPDRELVAMTDLLVLADARSEIANYLSAVITVYMILIIAYILSSLFFAFGGRVPYARWSSAILGFLRDVCEPYLGLFRRFIPPLGPLDLSPIVALLVLQIVGGIVVNQIRG